MGTMGDELAQKGFEMKMLKLELFMDLLIVTATTTSSFYRHWLQSMVPLVSTRPLHNEIVHTTSCVVEYIGGGETCLVYRR
jgi:hypothetical protein